MTTPPRIATFPLAVKPKSQPRETKDAREPRFEESLERLEILVQEMESGNLPLEEILKKYEEGNRLIQLCSTKLNEAEHRIEILMKGKDGSPALQPLSLKQEDETEQDEDDARPASGRGKNGGDEEGPF